METNDLYKFYVLFPGGYRINDIDNENLDAYVVFKNDFSKVYFISLFTLANIKQIMDVNKQSFFWSTNMLIIENLSKKMIYESINEIIKTDNLEFDHIFEFVGSYIEIFESNSILEELL